MDTAEIYAHENGASARRTPVPPRLARLAVLVGPGEGRSFDIADKCLLGRAAGVTLQIHDPGVSREHARISRQPSGDYVIEDCNSLNGTLVNGRRISRCKLRARDRIQLGRDVLLLFSEHDLLEEAMLQAQKMECIGRLSAGINHDFNNLLCVILSNAAYLRGLPSGMTLGHAEVRECLDDLHAAATSGAELTAQLSAFAETSPIAMQVVNVSEICRDLLRSARLTFPPSIEIHDRVRSHLHVRGVPSHIRQLVLNPLLNARDAMQDGGVLDVSLELVLQSEVGAPQPIAADAYVALVVRDSGPGMDQATLRHAFEPFFTTKDITIGSGLGLPMVRKVAKSHGGHVLVESIPGEGTTLRILLPAVAAPPSRDPEDESPGGVDDAHRTADDRPLASDLLHEVEQVRGRSGERDAKRGVVLVQPDAAAARATMRVLAAAGIYVILESRVADALRSAGPVSPRWVLVDEAAMDRASLADACRNAESPRIIVFASRPELWSDVPHVLAKPLAVDDLEAFLG